MNDIEAMLRSAPTTENGGDFVLFEGRDQFVGQFKTAEEGAAYIREHNIKRPTVLTLSMLNPKSYAFIVLLSILFYSRKYSCLIILSIFF